MMLSGSVAGDAVGAELVRRSVLDVPRHPIPATFSRKRVTSYYASRSDGRKHENHAGIREHGNTLVTRGAA
jgi:hypothetical protein